MDRPTGPLAPGGRRDLEEDRRRIGKLARVGPARRRPCRFASPPRPLRPRRLPHHPLRPTASRAPTRPQGLRVAGHLAGAARLSGARPARGLRRAVAAARVLAVDRRDVRPHRSGAGALPTAGPRLRVERGGAGSLRRSRALHARRHRTAARADRAARGDAGHRFGIEPRLHADREPDRRGRRQPHRPQVRPAHGGLRRRGGPPDRGRRLRARAPRSIAHDGPGCGRVAGRHDRPAAGHHAGTPLGHGRGRAGDAPRRVRDARARRQPARHHQRAARRRGAARLVPERAVAARAAGRGAPLALGDPRHAGGGRLQADDGLDDALRDGDGGASRR